jgi:glycosyltransferase involved in cell wall biosynthesis
MIAPEISVVVCTHNPRAEVFQKTVAGLRAQSLPTESWQLLVVDNASQAGAVSASDFSWHANSRIIVEPKLGLTPARLRGIAEATGAVIVFVDDDNVLAPEYLDRVRHLAQTQPRTGAWGGRVLPQFESATAPWHAEFLSMLALRDLGPDAIEVPAPGSPDMRITSYPESIPLGAGMAIRKVAATHYAATVGSSKLRAQLDRRGRILSSGGDNDLMLTVLRGGWNVAYQPELVVTHQIPAERLSAAYLGRLRRGIFRSWVAVRRVHGLPVSPPISRRSLPFRRAWAWFKWRAWRGDAAWVHWNGECGDLEGRADSHA